MFIDFNRKGVQLNTPHERVRFYLTLSENPYFEESKKRGVRDFFFGMPTHSGISDYKIVDGTLYLGHQEIGQVKEIENDTCDSTYPRRNGTVFNLNSRSKSRCRGCAFCHTFKQTPKDITELTPEEFVKRHIEVWLKKYEKADLSYLHRLDVVTGCFGDEREVLDHLRMVRDVFSRYNYHGEIFYFGSEITSPQAFDELREISPFSFCLSLECFENRGKLLRHHKAKISLESAKESLGICKKHGFGAQFSYVLGLEPLSVAVRGMEEFLPYINRIPVMNIFQPHAPEQTTLLHPDAREIDYFLNARKALEKVFVNRLLPDRTWGNYRCLWYLKYGNENLDGPRLP